VASEADARSHPTTTYLAASFEQVNERNGVEETARGVLHYLPERGRILLEVRDPLVQWIVIDSTETTVYYPDVKKTIRLGGVGLSPYQVFVAFWRNAPVETGLSSLGFEACSTRVRGDSLESWWKPAPGLGADDVRIRWIFRNDDPVRIDLHGKRGRLLETLRFGSYVESGGGRVPLEIESERFQPEAERERIVFSLPVRSEQPPAAILEFPIPDDAESAGENP
jgi:hypothetical protein